MEDIHGNVHEGLREWFEVHHSDWVDAVAWRAVLRVAPLLFDPEEPKAEVHENLGYALKVFRSLVTAAGVLYDERSWIGPSDREKACYAAYADQPAITGPMGSTLTIMQAAYLVIAKPKSAHRAYTIADTAMFISQGAKTALVQAIMDDCNWLEKNKQPWELLENSIWSDQPVWYGDCLRRASQKLQSSGKGFDVWDHWLAGQLSSEVRSFRQFDDDTESTFYDRIASFDDAWWQRDPAAVNRDVKALVDELRNQSVLSDSDLVQESTVVNYIIDENGVTQIAPEPMPNGVLDDQDTLDNYSEIQRLMNEALQECDPSRTQDTAMAPATELVLDAMGDSIAQLRPRLFVLRSKELVRRFEEKKSGQSMMPLSQGQSDAFAPLVDALRTIAEFDPKLYLLWTGRKDGESELTREQLQLVVLALADVKQMSPEAQQTVEAYVNQVGDNVAADDPALKQASDGVGNAVKAMGKAVKRSDEALKGADRAIRVAEKGKRMWDQLSDKLPVGATISRILEWLGNLLGGGPG